MRLLLVEAEIDIQNFSRSSLQEAGYQVEAPVDGKAAGRLAIDGQFDILIVDLGLPDQDGISLILRLRQLGLPAPVLILSARRSVDECVSGGARIQVLLSHAARELTKSPMAARQGAV
jgi:DNA-binding response OmpR family regulator